MSSILKEFIEYIIEKEEELANKKELDCKEIERQLTILLAKKDDIKKSCKERVWELNNLIERLHWIKAYALECKEKDNNE